MKSLNEKIKEAKERYDNKYVIRIEIIKELSKQLDLIKEALIVNGLKDVIITMDSRGVYIIFKNSEEAHKCYHTLLECDDTYKNYIVLI